MLLAILLTLAVAVAGAAPPCSMGVAVPGAAPSSWKVQVTPLASCDLPPPTPVVKGAMAEGCFCEGQNTTGWDELWVRARLQGGVQAAQGMGYLEGALVSGDIKEMYLNLRDQTFGNDQPVPAFIQTFLQDQMSWTADNRHLLPQGLGLVWAQFEGLAAALERGGVLQPWETYLLQCAGDLSELIDVMHHRQGTPAYVAHKHRQLGVPHDEALTECSAYVRPLPGQRDAIAAHTTWRYYTGMFRVWKRYMYPTGVRVAMSSSPGFLSSKDDYYVVNTSTIVMETTNTVVNTTLWDLVTPRGTLPTWLRTQGANVQCTGGACWTGVFGERNSGLYNNQFMVLDGARVAAGSPQDQLWIVEQAPGLVMARDVTAVMARQGYWKSFNIPYLPEVYAWMGYPEKTGDDWSYERCDRSRLFDRELPGVQTLADGQRLIRLNEWRTDPLSGGNPAHAIASRYDLLGEGRAQPFGAIDGKIAQLVGRPGESAVVSGPTTQDQPVFDFGEFPASRHRGVPTLFDFPWLSVAN